MLGVSCMAFLCVIGPEKINFICKIHFIEVYIYKYYSNNPFAWAKGQGN